MARGNSSALLLAVGAAVVIGVVLWSSRAKAITSGTVPMLPGKRYRLVFEHSKEAGDAYRATLLSTFVAHPEMQLVMELPSDTMTIAEAVAGNPDPAVIGVEVVPGVVLKSVQPL